MKINSAILIILVNMLPVFACCQDPAVDTTTIEYKVIVAVKAGDSITFDSLLRTNPSLIGIKEPIMEESLLHVAARSNQYEMVQKFVKKGLDVNAKNKLGSIPLHLACITGSYPMVNYLLIQGSDYTVANRWGKTPVDYVANGKNPELFNLFLAKDKNILNTTSADGTNLLFFSIYAGDTAGFSYLLKQGLDINSTDGHHFTPLFWAVRDIDSARISYLIKKGANVNAIGPEGITPLLFAIEIGNITTVKLLANAGANINSADSMGLTGLHKSAIDGYDNIVLYLVQNGAIIDSRDKAGMTPLQYAAIYGHSEIGRALILKGANPNITDNQQHDPVWYSTYYGNRKMTELLINSGAKKTDLKVQGYAVNLKPGEAVVHYLNHSGYAIETSGHLLVFDYFHYHAPPDNLSILNGRINPDELPAKKIIVFSSHDHGDHYDTTIWKWDSPKYDIQYVLGFKPEIKEPYVFIEPRQHISIGDVQINAIKSSDAGVGFLVEADGIVIYHPGDHVNRKAGLGQDFTNEIDYLAELNKKVDIAFFPVAGCGYPDLEVVKEGNFYVTETLKPAISFSMHGNTGQCVGFSNEYCLKYPGVQMEYGQYPGDRWNYKRNNSVMNNNTTVVDSGYVQVDGGKLFYETAGKGDPIVLLHDGMVDREVWDQQFPVLAKQYRVVRFDRRGYGKSSDATAPYSDIEDLNQVFLQLNIEKAMIFGMSSGGGLAIDFTLKYPTKVSALVLVGAVVSGYSYSYHMLTRGGHIKPATELSDPQKSIEYWAREDPYEIYSGNAAAKEKVVKILESNIHPEGRGFYKPADRLAAGYLSEIKVPALVLVGEYDIPDVHAHSGVIQFGIKNARREVILNSGHLIPLEQPRAFNESVLRFLKNIEFYRALDSAGVDAAVEYFNSTHRSDPDAVVFHEYEMNNLGYRYLQAGNIKDAIKLFLLNTIAYPDAWNTFDSLGEAYLKDGQTALAITNYKKSFELNPQNENAIKVLTELKEIKD